MKRMNEKRGQRRGAVAASSLINPPECGFKCGVQFGGTLRGGGGVMARK